MSESTKQVILVELDKEDLIRLVKGTGGPGSYVHPFEYIGGLTGFPNERWEWKNEVLNKMNEPQLFQLYKNIKNFK